MEKYGRFFSVFIDCFLKKLWFIWVRKDCNVLLSKGLHLNLHQTLICKYLPLMLEIYLLIY